MSKKEPPIYTAGMFCCDYPDFDWKRGEIVIVDLDGNGVEFCKFYDLSFWGHEHCELRNLSNDRYARFVNSQLISYVHSKRTMVLKVSRKRIKREKYELNPGFPSPKVPCKLRYKRDKRINNDLPNANSRAIIHNQRSAVYNTMNKICKKAASHIYKEIKDREFIKNGWFEHLIKEIENLYYADSNKKNDKMNDTPRKGD